MLLNYRSALLEITAEIYKVSQMQAAGFDLPRLAGFCMDFPQTFPRKELSPALLDRGSGR